MVMCVLTGEMGKIRISAERSIFHVWLCFSIIWESFVEEGKFVGRIVVEGPSCLFKGRGGVERKPDGVEGMYSVLLLSC
jgi:hypothetical protein